MFTFPESIGSKAKTSLKSEDALHANFRNILTLLYSSLFQIQIILIAKLNLGAVIVLNFFARLSFWKRLFQRNRGQTALQKVKECESKRLGWSQGDTQR